MAVAVAVEPAGAFRFAARPVLGIVLMLVLALAASFYLSFQYQVWQIDRELRAAMPPGA